MVEKQTYNHLDIKRYLAQKMSAKEMHAFEQAMMVDPFLADAVDGVSNSDEALTDHHLEQIKASIVGEKEKAKVKGVRVENDMEKMRRINQVLITSNDIKERIVAELKEDVIKK